MTDIELLLSSTTRPRSLVSNAKKTINGVLVVDLKKQHGATADYHMRKYGNLDRIGTPPGNKLGDSSKTTKYMYEGKSITAWAKELNANRRRLTKYFKEHNTIKGYTSYSKEERTIAASKGWAKKRKCQI